MAQYFEPYDFSHFDPISLSLGYNYRERVFGGIAANEAFQKDSSQLVNLEPDFMENQSISIDDDYPIYPYINYQDAQHDYSKEYNPPENILCVNEKVWASESNFSVIVGKAKSKKTYLLTAVIPAILGRNNVLGVLNSSNKYKYSKVLLFDTEQAPHHLQKVVMNSLKLGGFDVSQVKSRLKVFGLRHYSVNERLTIISQALESEERTTVAIIDGIRDCMYDINNMQEATRLVDTLMKWTYNYKIHIIVVIHENKTNNQIRGNIGTELMNKCETMIKVSVSEIDKNISIVEFPVTRDISPQPFAIKINDFGLIEYTNLPEKSQIKKKLNNYLYEKQRLSNVLEKLFTEKTQLNQSMLKGGLKQELGIGENKSREIISYCVEDLKILEVQNGTKGSRLYSPVC